MATPIGNLGDISLRALDVLKAVDAVAVEDTRITRRLLERYGIVKRLIPLHRHNERRATRQILALLGAGRAVALTSDAGTPAVSDPGALLVAAAHEAGFRVTPVPGANAALAALSVAGIAGAHFLFYGFLPARASERRRALAALKELPYTLVFHEAPHRVAEALADLAEILGPARRVVVARELTKLYETVRACTLDEAAAWLRQEAGRGEFVLVVEGAPASPARATDQPRAVLEALLAELPLRRAVEIAVRLTGARKNELYRLALQLKGEEGNGK